MFRLRARAQPMLQRGGGRRARPGARGSAHGLGPAGIPAGEQAGSRVGPGRIWALAIPAAVQRGSHASAAQPRAPRPRPQACSPHLAKERPPWDPRVPADRKVTSAGQGARARGGVWMGSVRVFPAVRKRRGRGEEAADAGCLPRLPAPLCRGFGGSAELRRGHTPRDRAEKANLVLTPLPGCGGMGHRSTLGLLRGNSLLHPGVGSGWGQHLATAANGVSLWMST